MQQSHELHWPSVPACCWQSFRYAVAPHLVHPGQTIPSIAPYNKACFRIYGQTNVKPFRCHARINLDACPPLPELYSLRVALEYFLDDFFY